MATIEEGSLCIVDANCSPEQYCYEVSGQCVDYTLCSRHNRAENVVRSRHPSHCGDCLPGYTAEVLGTGEKALLCQKISMQDDIAEPAKITNAVIVWIVIGALFVVVTATVGFFLRKRICALREKKKSKQWTELCIIGPSAPPAENSPFIGIGDERMTCESFNNNQNLKDKNRLVSATPYKEPNWVRTNPNYERNLSNEELSVNGQLQTMAQLPPSDNNSNSWIPGQMTIQVTSASLTDHATEERDNSLNTALVQGSRPSTSSGAGNNRSSANNSNNNSSGSTPNSNYSGSSRERLTANVLITQKISTNVNVVNAD